MSIEVWKTTSNPAIAAKFLRPKQFANGQAAPRLFQMEYGNALENMVTKTINGNELLSQILKHQRPGPDFIGIGPFSGLDFDLTTLNQVPAHFRSYGPDLITGTYRRPSAVSVFPEIVE